MEFKDTYNNYYAQLVAFCNGYLHDLSRSEGIAQESFIQLYFSKYKLKDRSKVKYYLYNTAKNLCLNEIRHLKIVDNYHKSSVVDSTIDIRDEMIRQETYHQLHLAIDRLPPKTKQVIVLMLKGCKLSEIAENLNISVSTVKTLRSNAYVKIKDYLKDYISALIISFFKNR